MEIFVLNNFVNKTIMYICKTNNIYKSSPRFCTHFLLTGSLTISSEGWLKPDQMNTSSDNVLVL